MKVKRNGSNFVHLNFCLCMIVPKSFSICALAKMDIVSSVRKHYCALG